MLGLIVKLRAGAGNVRASGQWGSAWALFVYAGAFSFAYLDLTAAAGALLLFGAVQVTMIGHGLRSGERLHGWQLAGLVLAVGGLVGLLAPGLTAPPVRGSALMLTAGVAWGIYSLRGRRQVPAGDPIAATAGNFLLAAPLAVGLGLWAGVWPVGGTSGLHLGSDGVACAVASGALASGLGYSIWYTALPSLRSTAAAAVQLSVPVLTAIGGVFLLREPMTWRLLLTSAAILGGIGLVILTAPRHSP